MPYPEKTKSGVKSRSTPGGSTSNYNELSFDDKKGSEQFHVQAERDYSRLVKNDEAVDIQNLQSIEVKSDRSITVKEGDERYAVEQGQQTISVKKDRQLTVTDGNLLSTVKQGDHSLKVSMGKSTIEAARSIELKVGSNSIKIDQSGITIQGIQVKINGDATTKLTSSGVVTVKGSLVQIN